MIQVEHNTERRAGLTMVELLVSVVVLLVVMLSFGMIMRQIQRVVSTGEKSIRTNSAAAAIVGAIRSDIGRATRNGMMCITQTGAKSPPLLTFTAAGVVPSKTDAGSAVDRASANASLVAMSLCDNTSTASPSPDLDVLYSQRWLLTDVTHGDRIDLDLANIQRLPRSGMNAGVLPRLSGIALPCSTSTPDEADNLWPVLADRCEWVSVTWTDGQLDANGLLRWYGVDYDAGQYVVKWRNTPPDPTNVEFDVSGVGANVYRALWTHHDQNNWPRALRIRYRLIEDANATPIEGRVYEVICPVGG